MTRLHLVRHGRASAGWNVDPDPGLDDLGRSQALTVAVALSPLQYNTVYSSPLLRCQQTAFPLATAWGVTATIEPRVAEIPSPEGIEMADRVEWLRNAMQGTWSELGGSYVAYRDDIVSFLKSVSDDAVIFSHFIAINAVIGHCLNDDKLLIRSLDNCSVTVLERSDDGELTLLETGSEADTLIR